MTPAVADIALAALRAFTPSQAAELLARVGSAEEFFRMKSSDVAAVVGRGVRVADGAFRAKAMAAAQTEAEFIERTGVNCIPWTSPLYPRRLLECCDAPLMLFQYGTTPLNFPAAISIVGTRHATQYGTDFVADICSQWASTLVTPPTVVSGLAYGIDIAAHRGAMAAGLTTVGVVAHGLNTIYPSTHRNDAAKMTACGGSVVTEYLSSDAIHKGNFLARNRIIAGMADALLVVESDSRGGALVTARLAADYSRTVLALPGRISDRYSRGCNNLIMRHEAQLVTSAADIAEVLSWPSREAVAQEPTLFPTLSADEESIIDALTAAGSAKLEEIAVRLPHLTTFTLMSVLLDMECRSLISRAPDGAYSSKI